MFTSLYFNYDFYNDIVTNCEYTLPNSICYVVPYDIVEIYLPWSMQFEYISALPGPYVFLCEEILSQVNISNVDVIKRPSFDSDIYFFGFKLDLMEYDIMIMQGLLEFLWAISCNSSYHKFLVNYGMEVTFIIYMSEVLILFAFANYVGILLFLFEVYRDPIYLNLNKGRLRLFWKGIYSVCRSIYPLYGPKFIYWQSEYEELFYEGVTLKITNAKLKKILTIIFSLRYVDTWYNGYFWWRICVRVLYMIFILPFITAYICCIRLFFFYLSNSNLLNYILYLFLLFYTEIKSNITLPIRNFFCSIVVYLTNKLAFLTFFGYHFTSYYFIYLFLPKKFHIHDPDTYKPSYPAKPHPWFRYLFNCFSPLYFTNLKLFKPLKILTLRLFFSIYQMAFVSFFFPLIKGLTNNLIAHKFNLLIIDIIILLKSRIINHLWILLIVIFFFFFKYYILIFNLFVIISIYGLFTLYSYSSKIILYVFDCIFLMIGYFFYFPFWLVAFLCRLFIFFAVQFNFYFLIFLFICFVFKFDFLTFAHTFTHYFILDVFDPFLIFSENSLGYLGHLYYNWKYLLLEYNGAGIYAQADVDKRALLPQIRHYNTLLFDAVGLIKLSVIKLWFNFNALFVKRINNYKYLKMTYFYSIFYCYILKSPFSTLFIFIDYSYIYFFYMKMCLNYIYYSLVLHIHIYINIFFLYILPSSSSIIRLKYLYFNYFYPFIFNMKLYFIFNMKLHFILDIISIGDFKIFLLEVYVIFLYIWELLYSYFFNYLLYSYFPFLFSTINLFIYWWFLWIFDVCGYLNNFFSYNISVYDFIQDLSLRVTYWPNIVYLYNFDWLYSHTRLSPLKLDSFYEDRELYLTSTNWRNKILYYFRLYHPYNLQHNNWRFTKNGENYFDSTLGNFLSLYRWQGYMSWFAEIYNILFFNNCFYYISRFNFRLALVLIFLNFLLGCIFILFIYILFFRTAYISNQYYNNADYLWRLFRQTERNSLTTWAWISESSSKDVLEHYTQQLLDVEFDTPYAELMKDEQAVLTLASLFNKFSQQQEKIMETYNSSELFKPKSKFKKDNRSKIKTKKEVLKDIKLLKSLIKAIMGVRAEVGLPFESDFIKKMTSSLSFDYNRLISDNNYKYYYQTHIEEGIVLNIFISRGMLKNAILKNIYLCDLEPITAPLDIVDEQDSIAGETIWNQYLDLLWFIDNCLFNKLPYWIISKDQNGIFVHKNRKTKRDFYICDLEGYSFDLIYMLFFAVPVFLLVFLSNFYFKTSWTEIFNGASSWILYYKLYLFNSIFTFGEFLKYNGVTSWYWNVIDEVTIGNGYPEGYAAFGINLINNHFSILDPLYLYDNIFKETQILITPIVPDMESSFVLYIGLNSVKAFCMNKYLAFLEYINPLYSSNFFTLWNWCTNIFFFCYLFSNFIFNKFYNKKVSINIFDKKFFVYVHKIYHIKLIKINNYLKKLWF